MMPNFGIESRGPPFHQTNAASVKPIAGAQQLRPVVGPGAEIVVAEGLLYPLPP
jgi:hypothetical protein